MRHARPTNGAGPTVTVPVTIIEQTRVRKTCCTVPRATSASALRRWLTQALDLGDPAAWGLRIRRQPRTLHASTLPLHEGDHLYLIRRP
jgi:hypothetical protein